MVAILHCDHASLQYLRKQREPTKRLTRWLDEFAAIDAPIIYKRGSEMVVPDALSRRADYSTLAAFTPAPPPADALDPTDQKRLSAKPAFDSISSSGTRRTRSSPLWVRTDQNARRSSRKPIVQTCSISSIMNMGTKVCASCPQCQIFSSNRKGQELEEMHPLPPCEPFERLVDHATGWPVAIPLPVATSQRVVDAIWDHIILHYGFPSEILSDRGKNFHFGISPTHEWQGGTFQRHTRELPFPYEHDW